MPITTELSSDGDTLTISIKGKFDFTSQNDFRSSYQDAKANYYVINLIDTEYMDSSALGMLLLMREHAGGMKSDIKLENCSSDIKAILSVANFHNLFKIT